MKNQIPFKSESMCLGYMNAVLWLNQFNLNLLPNDKIRNWKVEYKNNYVILKF